MSSYMIPMKLTCNLGARCQKMELAFFGIASYPQPSVWNNLHANNSLLIMSFEDLQIKHRPIRFSVIFKNNNFIYSLKNSNRYTVYLDHIYPKPSNSACPNTPPSHLHFFFFVI